MNIAFYDHPSSEYIFELDGLTVPEQLAKIQREIDRLAAKYAKLTIIPNGPVQQVQMVIHYVTMHYPQKLAIVQPYATWHNRVIEQEVMYHLLHEHIEENRFFAAQLLAQGKDKTLMHLLQFAKNLSYGESKFSNDNHIDYYFEQLEMVLVEQMQAPNDKIQFVRDMRRLKQGNQLAFLFFLQSMCQQLYQKSDLTDFILFFYRLVEETLLYAMGWDVPNEHVSGNPYKYRAGAKQKVVLPNLLVSRHFNSYIQYLKEENSPYARELLAIFNVPWLINCIRLRHDGVGGHGFEAYRLQQLEQFCNGSPLEKIDELLTKFNIKSPYYILTVLKEAMAARARMLIS